MLRSSHDACGCSTQTTSTINLKRSTLHPHEGQADRPNTPSDSVNLGSNPGPPAMHLPDMTVYFQFGFLMGSGDEQQGHPFASFVTAGALAGRGTAAPAN